MVMYLYLMILTSLPVGSISDRKSFNCIIYRRFLHFHFYYISLHRIGQFVRKAVNLAPFPLSQQLDPAIRQVPDITVDGKPAGYFIRCIPKPDPLHPSAEQNFSCNRHEAEPFGVTGTSGSPSFRPDFASVPFKSRTMLLQ